MVSTGVLIRRPVNVVFTALADPTITTRFWFTKSTSRMEPGAKLLWTWEMYNMSSHVSVTEVRPGSLIRFMWDGYDPANSMTVIFRFVPYGDVDGEASTYVRITETGFSGDADTQVQRAVSSIGGFTFYLSALKAALEHDITLRVVKDAFPPGLVMPED